MDKSKMEAESVEHAGRKGGEFVERLMTNTGCGSDFTTWTPEVYAAFVEEIVTGFVERMLEIKLAADEHPPF